MGVAKKTDGKKKGELMEQNQDALEYSSEEDEEDIRDTMASIASKGKKVGKRFIIITTEILLSESPHFYIDII